MALNVYNLLIGTPPVTRLLFLSILTLTLLVYVNAIQPYALLYSSVFLKYMEIWRIFTCFLYFGKPSLDVLVHIIFLYRYSRMLEEGFIYTSDYVYLIFIIWAALFMIANILRISTLATAFSSTITYIWTRKNSNATVQMFEFISFPAFYLPFIVPLFMLFTEKRILLEDILGILVGHFYYFFKDVYPKFGADILRTPCILKKIFKEHPEDCCKKKKNGRVLKFNKTINRGSVEVNKDADEKIIAAEATNKSMQHSESDNTTVNAAHTMRENSIEAVTTDRPDNTSKSDNALCTEDNTNTSDTTDILDDTITLNGLCMNKGVDTSNSYIDNESLYVNKSASVESTFTGNSEDRNSVEMQDNKKEQKFDRLKENEVYIETNENEEGWSSETLSDA